MRATCTAAALFALLAAPAGALRESRPVAPAVDLSHSAVILDPGHGGDDMGAVVKGRVEKTLALEIAKKLRARLKVPVTLTRDDDRYVTLDKRVVDAVDSRAAAFVSLHLNQVKSTKVSGAVVYSYGPELRRKWRGKRLPSVPPMPSPPKTAARESESLARAFVRQMRKDGFRVEPAKADYYVLKNPAAPAVLIELGYLTNPEEAARLADPAHQDKLVETLAKALESWLGERALLGGSYTAER